MTEITAGTGYVSEIILNKVRGYGRVRAVAELIVKGTQADDDEETSVWVYRTNTGKLVAEVNCFRAFSEDEDFFDGVVCPVSEKKIMEDFLDEFGFSELKTFLK